MSCSLGLRAGLLSLLGVLGLTGLLGSFACLACSRGLLASLACMLGLLACGACLHASSVDLACALGLAGRICLLDLLGLVWMIGSLVWHLVWLALFECLGCLRGYLALL